MTKFLLQKDNPLLPTGNVPNLSEHLLTLVLRDDETSAQELEDAFNRDGVTYVVARNWLELDNLIQVVSVRDVIVCLPFAGHHRRTIRHAIAHHAPWLDVASPPLNVVFNEANDGKRLRHYQHR